MTAQWVACKPRSRMSLLAMDWSIDPATSLVMGAAEIRLVVPGDEYEDFGVGD